MREHRTQNQVNSADSAEAILEASLLYALKTAEHRPLIFGLSGAQGSGKSTLARRLVTRTISAGHSSVAISLDDFYFGRNERRRGIAKQHPLFITRGPPGTHNIALANEVFDALHAGREAALPHFDKGNDEPLARGDWPKAPAALDVVIFDGWCLGAKSEPAGALRDPINALERYFDADGAWRTMINECLGSQYRPLFDRIDLLVFLRAPSFEIVVDWRREQEVANARSASAGSSGIMSQDEIGFFVQHFERISRSMLSVDGVTADFDIPLDRHRRAIRLDGAHSR